MRHYSHALAAVGIVLAAAGGAGAETLLIAESSTFTPPPMTSGFFTTVDTFDTLGGTPTLAQLQAYDAVLAYTDNTPADPAGLGNVLADYVDTGGTVLLATYGMSSPWDITGGIQGPGYNPFNNASNGDVSGTVNAVVPTDSLFSFPHAISTGSITYFHNANFAQPTLDAGATLLADDGPTGRRLFAVNAAGNVCGMNLFPAQIAGNNAEFFELVENGAARCIPEPATLSLLALGAIALIRRR